MSTENCFGPARSLVHDEVVKIARKKGRPGSLSKYAIARIRVWRGVGWPSVVLVSEASYGDAPAWDTNLYSNYALSALLLHDPEGMSYFEDYQAGDVRKLHLISFREAGCELRKHLYNPKAVEQGWATLEQMIGIEIAH